MPSLPLLELKFALALHVILALVILLPMASSTCSDEQANRTDIISYCFPSFNTNGSLGGLQTSWDAGAINGALHLTSDDVNQPVVIHPPAAMTSAGYAFLTDVIRLWRLLSSGSGEASFETSFTMRVNRSGDHNDDDGGLILEVLPYFFDGTSNSRPTYLVTDSNYPDVLPVAIEFGMTQTFQDTYGMYVSILPSPNSSSVNYTVWINYNPVVHNLSVYVVEEGRPKPGAPTYSSSFNIRDTVRHSGDSAGCYIGLFSSKNRTLPSCQAVVYNWNLMVENLLPIPGGGGRRRRWLAAALLSAAAVLAVAVLLVLAVRYFVPKYRARKQKLKVSQAVGRLPGMLIKFNHAAIRKATNHFNEGRKLGQGGYGTVYKGTLPSGKLVAVKKFTRTEDCGYKDFLAQIDIINRLSHRNIVPLLGWSYEEGELLLVYEYMPNGSLDKYLRRDNKQEQTETLGWERYYGIIKDIAAGLHYMHHGYESLVLHRDIKPNNILLDNTFRALLGDFGLAQVIAVNKDSFTDWGVAGTKGFIAPEYAVGYKATRQTDVYAFGALVLEVVTGRRSVGAADDEFPLLVDWVWSLHKEKRLLEGVDGVLSAAADFDADEADRLLLLGLACSDTNGSSRPTMADVVQVLAKTVLPPDVPHDKPDLVWPPGGALSSDKHDGSGPSHCSEEKTSSSIEILEDRQQQVETLNPKSELVWPPDGAPPSDNHDGSGPSHRWEQSTSTSQDIMEDRQELGTLMHEPNQHSHVIDLQPS